MISIYIYENLINGKVYVGQTNNMKIRDAGHIKGDKSMPIDCAIKKYGRNNFSLAVITEVDTKNQADYAEIDWIARTRELLGRENVYNIGDGGEINSFAGRKHTEESKRKIREARAKQVISEENKKMFSQVWKGRKHSEETKKKMLEDGRKGRKHAEETKQKMSIAKKGKEGRKQTEETKKKLSEVKRAFTDEQEKEIIILYSTGNYTSRQLAKQFGVGQTTILRVINRNKEVINV